MSSRCETFADEAQLSVRPDLGLNCLQILSGEDFFVIIRGIES